jgi:hypothetical protein
VADRRNRPQRGKSEVSSAPRDEWRRSALRRIATVAALLIATGVVALALSSSRPTVYASLETDLPAATGSVELLGARRTQPTTVDLESFGLILGGSRIPADEEEISIQIPVSQRSCQRLVAQIGGGCDGEPAAALQQRENLKIQAADRPFSVSVVEGHAAQLQLVQGGERTHRGAPVAWSLADDAATTLVQFECEPATPLTITLSPHHAKASCELGASRYELVVANDAAFSPALSFGRVRGFDAGFRSDRASIDARGGALTVDKDEGAIPGSETTAVELVPAGSDAVAVGVTAPTAHGVGETWLRSPHTAHALVNEEERVPSRLAQSKSWVVPWIALLMGVVLDAVIFLVSSRRH